MTCRLKHTVTDDNLGSVIRNAASQGMMVVSVKKRPLGGYKVQACDRMVPESVLKAFIAGTRISVTFKDGVELNPPDNCEPLTL